MTLNTYLLMALVLGPIVGGGIGMLRVSALGGQNYWLAFGVWAWGTLLFLFLAHIGLLLGIVAECSVISGSEALNLDGCAPYGSWFLVLTKWQTGVGAAIGLLGVAWSTLVKSMYGVE